MSYFFLFYPRTRSGNNRPLMTALLLLAACAAMLVGCERKPSGVAAVPVKVTVLRPEQITASTRFSGSIEPLQSTSLAFKLPGTVSRLYRPAGLSRDVQVGDMLSKGTVIAEFDEGDLRRALHSAEARVAQFEARVQTARENLVIAQRNFERYANSEGAVSEAARDDADAKCVTATGELATAEHALADARVQLDQANDNYNNRQLVVPFDHATVAEKHIEPGERKAAHEVAFRLIDISSVHINFGVPDTMVGKPALETTAVPRVFLGQTLPLSADAFEGRTLTGAVTKIAPEADPKTRTFLTQLTVENPETSLGQRLLRPGMIVSVTVGAALDRAVILIPTSAVHHGRAADEFIVYEVVAEQGREIVRTKRVKLGGVFNNQVELILAGSELREGSRVVVSTAERLADGLSVRVIGDKSAASSQESK